MGRQSVKATAALGLSTCNTCGINNLIDLGSLHPVDTVFPLDTRQGR